MAEIWGTIAVGNEVEFEGLDFFNTQWRYGEPTEANCLDIWDLLDLENPFIPNKEGKKHKKESITIR